MTGRRSYLRTIGLMLAGAMLMAAVLAFVRTPLQGDTADPGLMSPITVEAEWSQEWQDGDAYIGIFRGRCRVIQGSTVFAARQMVIWSTQAETPAGVEDRLSVYLEDDVQVTSDLGNRAESSLLVELTTNRGVSLTSTGRITDHSGDQEPLYQRAVVRRERGTHPADPDAAHRRSAGADQSGPGEPVPPPAAEQPPACPDLFPQRGAVQHRKPAAHLNDAPRAGRGDHGGRELPDRRP